MIDLIPSSPGSATMSSLQIAEITGKEHRNIMIDIRRILAEAGIDGARFLASQTYGNNNTREFYILPRRDSQHPRTHPQTEIRNEYGVKPGDYSRDEVRAEATSRLNANFEGEYAAL